MLPDRLLWELADVVDESLLTLGKRRYINEEYSADEFEEVLYAFPCTPGFSARSALRLPRTRRRRAA
jgi:hypothetical protein